MAPYVPRHSIHYLAASRDDDTFSPAIINQSICAQQHICKKGTLSICHMLKVGTVLGTHSSCIFYFRIYRVSEWPQDLEADQSLSFAHPPLGACTYDVGRMLLEFWTPINGEFPSDGN